MKTRTTFAALIFVLSVLVPVLGQSQTVQPVERLTKNDKFVRSVILEKPEPKAPENYHGPKIKPTVVLTAVFRSWGEVTNIKLVKVTPADVPKELSKELVKRCKKAAKLIKFLPATRDGDAVSMLMQLEYTFDMDKYVPEDNSPTPR
ncbi:MAG TPA: hypothetical protein VJR02_01425 [Pyrinomonadaceae bacterium]|nr:hypothetical protein [Pyrinomonadaceae bacterium]